MGTVITSLANANARGVYILFERELAAAKAAGTARVVMLATLPWGPVGLDSDGEIPSFESPAAFRAMFAPAGFTRTGPAYNLATKFPWPDLKIIRVLASDAVKATINMQKAGPLDCVAVTAKWFGSEGNGITAVVADASNGVANSFNLTITKTNSTTGKSTVEKYTNVDSTQTAASYWTALTANSVLVGGLVKSATGRPVNGTYTLASGSDGSALVASDWLGTPGSPDKGLSLCEVDPDINFIFHCGVASGITATVNAGMAAHKTLMNDSRLMLLHSATTTETASAAKTASALNQAEGVYYVNGWGKVIDEDATSDSTPYIEIPLSGVVAGFCSTIQPHVSPAIKNKSLTAYFAPVKGLTVGPFTKAQLADLESNGVIAFEKNSNAVFSPYCGIASDQATQMFVTRMRRFIMFSLDAAIEDYRNSPNADQVQEDERTIVSAFLEELVANGKSDPLFKPSVKAAELLSEESANTAASEAAGDYYLPFQVQLLSEQARIFLKGRIGTSTLVTVSG